MLLVRSGIFPNRLVVGILYVQFAEQQFAAAADVSASARGALMFHSWTGPRTSLRYVPLRAAAVSRTKKGLSEVDSASVFALRPGVGKLSGKAKLVNI